MAKLTAKQEKFCTEYVTCGNASEAYRRAYDVEKINPGTIRIKATALINTGKVAVRIRELQLAEAQHAPLSLEEHLEALGRLRDLAVEQGKLSAAVSAEISRGKAAGLYTDKVQADVKQDVKVVLFGGE